MPRKIAPDVVKCVCKLERTKREDDMTRHFRVGLPRTYDEPLPAMAGRVFPGSPGPWRRVRVSCN